MPRTSPTIAALSILILTAIFLPASAETVYHGSAGLQVGSLEHPLGLADEPSSLLKSGSVDLTATTDDGPSFWRWSYSGSLDLFDDDVPLDYMRHAIGLERIMSSGSGRPSTGVGMRWTTRNQLENAALYDHTELDGYLTRKSYPAPNMMLRTVLGARLRGYGDLPEESFFEPHGMLELKRFSESRTTLGATVRLGGKWFHDPIASRVWGTDGTPSSSQLDLNFSVAQGISDRVGARATFNHRVSLADFPYWVQDDLVDNPLLDRYARSGPSARGSVKILAPLLIWVQTGVAWADNDYGAILFDDGDGVGQRQDTVVDLFVSLEKKLSKDTHGTVLTFSGTWRDQTSTLETYDWSGVTLVGGVEWRW